MRKEPDRDDLCLIGKVDLIIILINTMKEKYRVL